MKYRNKMTGEVVDVKMGPWGNWHVEHSDGNTFITSFKADIDMDYEPMPEYVQTLQLTGFEGGLPFIYRVPLGTVRLEDYRYKVPGFEVLIDAITNTYREDGRVAESWTAKNVKDGATLTNNLTGALHELPRAAVEALLVLRSCH